MRQPSAEDLRAARQANFSRNNERRDRYVQGRRTQVIVEFGGEDDATAFSELSGFRFDDDDLDDSDLNDNRDLPQ